MTQMKILDMLKGIGGTYEVNRVVGTFGAVVYIVGVQVFVAWMLIKGREFDLIAYCTAFPGGLAIAVGAIAGAVAIKDRHVATAQVVRETGGQPHAAAGDMPAGTEGDPLIIAGAPAGSPPVRTTPGGAS